MAELKASSQKKARVTRKKNGAGAESAIMASAAPTTNCRETIQERFVRIRSTKGDQSGLMTQGRYSQLV